MSIIYNPEVACDAIPDPKVDAHCQNTIKQFGYQDSPPSKRDLRVKAQEQGFLHIGHNDYCMDHSGDELRRRFQLGKL